MSAGTGSGGGGGGFGGGDPAAFYAVLCSACHGSRGEGLAALGPEIQHPVRDFSTWVVRNGRRGHPSYPGSTMEAFPSSLLSDAALKTLFDSLSAPTVPKPTTGEALFKDYCANCHGASGTGGTAGEAAKGAPLSKALSMVRNGHNLTQFASRTGYMPKWSAAELTDAEVGLIVTYLNSL